MISRKAKFVLPVVIVSIQLQLTLYDCKPYKTGPRSANMATG